MMQSTCAYIVLSFNNIKKGYFFRDLLLSGTSSYLGIRLNTLKSDNCVLKRVAD